METKNLNHLPLVVIVGPTASGKTDLAVKLALQFDGEIICADSRTVYKAMDVGTAKPTPEEQAKIPHWGIDLVEPGERFTAADFKQYADQKIKEIRARGHVPFLVGGTGLYVDAVVFNYQFDSDVDEDRRTLLEKLSLEELHDYCYKNNINLPENQRNKRYVVRAIEQNGVNSKRSEMPIKDSIIVGIATDKVELRERIKQRTEQLFNNDVVEEATLLGKKYGWNSEAMTGNVYPLILTHLKAELSLEQIIDKNTTLDWRLAKRQLTWLKRNPFIYWCNINEAYSYLSRQLASK